MIYKLLDLVDKGLDKLNNLIDSSLSTVKDNRIKDLVDAINSTKTDETTIILMKLKINDLVAITKQTRDEVIEDVLKLSKVSELSKNTYRKLLK